MRVILAGGSRGSRRVVQDRASSENLRVIGYISSGFRDSGITRLATSSCRVQSFASNCTDCSIPHVHCLRTNMKNQTRAALIIFVVMAAFLIETSSANANRIGVCIRNCAQCKKMFGAYFEGQLCADTCIKFKGKIIPDCEDASSIAPFVTKLDDE